MKTKAVPAPKGFDKYKYYMDSVQNADGDAKFFLKTYKELKNKRPKSLREDFCGTFSVCCEWIKLDEEFESYGVDLDIECIEYGKKNILTQLPSEDQKRVHAIHMNVLDKKAPVTDIICAQNFSYFLFKKREDLKNYFANAYRTVAQDGIFVIDCFGGGQCQAAIEEETKYKDFSYFWDQVNYNPITNEAEFFIHFKLKGQRKIKKVFYYDWRMWTIPELREILAEVGFVKTHVYWEGTTTKGTGNGIFKRTEKGEECDSWIAYIVSEK